MLVTQSAATRASATSRAAPRPVAGRNAGLAVAEGEIAAFIDDDVVVDPAWLDSSVRAFGAAADVACVTGMILPLTSRAPPRS
jgi:GT2 family glycosyltransferase